jgi:hypothetical protein
MVRPNIDFSREALVDLCRRHHIRRLSLFGSVLREEFGPDSDIDVLVEFDPSHVVGFRIFRVEEELSRLFGGHRVDLVNPKYLNRHVKDRILSSAQVQYNEG